MENDENRELSPEDALASAAAGRDAVSRRVYGSWVWDACMAVSLGIYMALLSYVSDVWAGVVIPAWVIAFLALRRARERSTGIVSVGNTRRTLDPFQFVGFGLILVLFPIGISLGNRWIGAPVVTSLLATAIVYVGSRHAGRRAASRMHN
jgi:hypothetical protein